MKRVPLLFLPAIIIAGFFIPAWSIDYDEDGLSDVWEAVYNAQSLTPGGDPDGDGFTNLEESNLGTDPFDRDDNLSVKAGRTSWKDGAVVWTPQPGKAYRPRLKAEIPDAWTDVAFVARGGASELKLALSDGKVTGAEGAVFRQVWTPAVGNTLDPLLFQTTDPAFAVVQAGLDTPPGTGEFYASKVTGFITPPASGTYRFWMSAREDALFKMGPGPDRADLVVASVTDLDLEPGDIQGSPTQQSAPISMTEGVEHAIEILHISGVGNDHLSIFWQGPGMSSPESIPASALSMRLPEPVEILGGNPAGFFASLGVEDLDSDGDGVFDWEEIQAGTSPFDPTSASRDAMLPVSDLIAVSEIYDLLDVVDVAVFRGGSPITSAAEGTAGITIRATRDYPVSSDTIIPFNHVGLARPGEDYTLPGDQIVIPAGQVSASIPLTLIDDNDNEGVESLALLMQTNFDFISLSFQITD